MVCASGYAAVTGMRSDLITAADCFFYHSVDLPLSGPQAGLWDLRGRFDDYVAHQKVDGKTVLDVGTASGFLTFEAERRGATVTSFDTAHADRWFILPFHNIEVDPGEQEKMLERWKNSYWLCHREFESSAKCVYGDVYDLSPGLVGVFDVVLVGQILVHLPDAISALAAAASVCRDTIVVVEGNFANDTALAALCGRVDHPEVAYAWYHYSHGWYREILAILGFSTVTITTDRFRCNDSSHDSAIELDTIVASR